MHFNEVSMHIQRFPLLRSDEEPLYDNEQNNNRTRNWESIDDNTGNSVNTIDECGMPVASITQTVAQTTTDVDAQIRKWKVHQGNNRFALHGKMVCSKQNGVSILTMFLITTTLAIYFIFDAPFMWSICPLIPLVALVLALIVISNFCLTSFSDPGILPRVDNLELIELDRQATNEEKAENSIGCRPRQKEVIVNGEKIRMKYCTSCRLFRPPRSSHCAVCDNCVLMFDHHCPWVGNCIGLRNYAYFYWFVFSSSLLDIYMFVCSFAHLLLESKRLGTFADAIRMTPISMVVTTVCFLSIWSLLGLLCFHTYLSITNQTTNEDLKGTFRNKNRNSTSSDRLRKNPYSKGCLMNWIKRICRPQFPSVLDASGFVEQNPSIVIQKGSATNNQVHQNV